jgi:thioredoxin reductase
VIQFEVLIDTLYQMEWIMYDVIVVGGSYAGCAAALQLARARREILVIDAGVRRNRFATHAHGFLGQDGRDPAEIAATARAELLAYPTVTWLEGTATNAMTTPEGFVVRLAAGEQHHARRLVLASGVSDELPDIPGVAERWGQSIFHCPYCHGYELNEGRIGVLATRPLSVHSALMLPDWGPTTYFTRGLFEPDADETLALERRGVQIECTAVTAVSGVTPKVSVTLADSRSLSFAGLFLLPTTRPSSPLAEQLGCTIADGPLGPYIQTDELKATSLRGVFACGDVAVATGSIAFAVGDGARAGAAAHRSLMFDSDV